MSEKHDWPDCKEIQCEQAHESWRTVLAMLGLECPDEIYVVGKAIRVAQAIGDLKVNLTELHHKLEAQRKKVQEAHIEFHKDPNALHGPDEEHDPAAFIRIVRLERDKAQSELTQLRQQVEELKAIRQHFETKLEAAHRETGQAKADYEGLLKHHEATDEIIKDAQGQRPEDGKRLLHNYDRLKQENIELKEKLLCYEKT